MEVKKVPKVQFGDVARECRETYKGDQTGMPVVGLEHLEPETMTLHAWGSSADNSFTKCFHKGQVLFGRRRAYLKKAVVAPFNGICSGDITVIEAKADILNPDLLPFIVQNDDFFRFAVGHSAGSLSPRVKWEHLQNYEFTLPSIAEQDELVELLQAMERTKNAYKALIAKTDELVKSQFVEMFGDPVSNAKAWQMRPLKETCALMTGNTPSRAVKEYYGSYIEWIKSDNIANSSLYLTAAAESLSEKGAEVGRVVHPGTILMTCIAGSLNTIGNVAIVDRDVAFNQQINAIIPHQYDTLFLCYLLKLLKPKLHEAASSALKCILNKGNLEAFTAIVPDMALQKEFSSFVVQSDKSKFAAQQALADLTATQKALMRQYLG